MICLLQDDTLIVLGTETLQVKERFDLGEAASQVQWSPDDAFILAKLIKKNQIQIRNINPEALEGGNESFEGVIQEAGLNIDQVMWAPDSRSILVGSDLGIKISIWSLTKMAQIAAIKNPKHPLSKCMVFT
jgi:hypothetical protein